MVHQKIVQPTPHSSSTYPTNIWQPPNLLPPIAEVSPNTTAPEYSFSSPIQKDDLNDIFDEEQLISLISKPNREKAKQLLQIFNERSNELTWNSSGTIFIDQVSIPNTNIFVLFPLLFKKSKPKNINGLNALIQKINDMGLGDYIYSKRSKKSDNIAQSLSGKGLDMNKDPETNVPWWYIGD